MGLPRLGARLHDVIHGALAEVSTSTPAVNSRFVNVRCLTPQRCRPVTGIDAVFAMHQVRVGEKGYSEQKSGRH